MGCSAWPWRTGCSTSAPASRRRIIMHRYSAPICPHLHHYWTCAIARPLSLRSRFVPSGYLPRLPQQMIEPPLATTLRSRHRVRRKPAAAAESCHLRARACPWRGFATPNDLVPPLSAAWVSVPVRMQACEVASHMTSMLNPTSQYD
jgi:hypothetical protein